MNEMLKRVLEYANKEFDYCRLNNSYITKRETIGLGVVIK